MKFFSHRKIEILQQVMLPVIIFLQLCAGIVQGQSLQFRKVNSGTRASIIRMAEGFDHSVFFQTDRIHRLEGLEWKSMDVSVTDEISRFDPVTFDEVWFTVNQVTNTSIIYHHRRGQTEILKSPFPNDITGIVFIDPDSALIGGPSDVASYHNGKFTLLPSVPTRHYFAELLPTGSGRYLVLIDNGELYFFCQGKYERVKNTGVVRDIALDPGGTPWFLTDESISSLNGTKTINSIVNPMLKNASSMAFLSDGSLLVVGKSGMMLKCQNSVWVSLPVLCTEHLTGILALKGGETWVYGMNGRILYSGKKEFQVVEESGQGFAPHKMIAYNIRTDDEYGVGMADFNEDGKPDIYAVRIFEQNRLYINNIIYPDQIAPGKGFRNEAMQRNALGAINPMDGLLQGDLKMGIAVADVDNDLDKDIYLCYLNSNNRLLLNNGKGYFRNVSEQNDRACGNYRRSNASAFSDVDLDGDLDLFVTSEEGSNRLFENNGTGQFTDITIESGLASVTAGMCAAFSDINHDGLPDLFVTFWYPGNKLYLNKTENGRIRFVDQTEKAGFHLETPTKSNAVIFGDINNDGWQDLFIANRNDANRLYLNDRSGRFIQVTDKYIGKVTPLSNGAVFADFDLDGYLDLYVSGIGGNILYRNIKGESFSDITAITGSELGGYCTGSAVGDVDNDGDPDLYAANYINGNSILFLNVNEGKNFIKLHFRGVNSNRDGIGTKVWLYRVTSGGAGRSLAGYRELSAGNGYGSTSLHEMIFGVEQIGMYEAKVKFPSSSDTLILSELRADTSMMVFEKEGVAALKINTYRFINRSFSNPEIQPEIMKFILVCLFLVLYNYLTRKNPREVRIYSIGGSVIIFLLFLTINSFFLYSGSVILYLVSPVIVFVLIAVIHLYISRRILSKLMQKEKLELREKLSRDLHDDLASTLGSISLYSETLNRMTSHASPEAIRLSGKITSLTRSVLQSISDIIWMTSPRNDSLQSLVSKIGFYINEILADNRIEFSQIAEIPSHAVILKEHLRNDVFLIVKEGLNNIIRHSGAGKVVLKVICQDGMCTLSLSDNGCGFNVKQESNHVNCGNGLSNMQKRAVESAIHLKIISASHYGTEIILRFRI